MKLKKMLMFFAPLAITSGVVVGAVSCGVDSTQTSVVLALDGSTHSESDRSFNEAAYDGIKSFLGADKASVFKPAGDDIASFKQMYANIKSGSTVVATGYLHQAPLAAATNEINGKNIILLDSEVKKANIASVIYHPEQAAFIAGYVLGKYLDDHFNESVVKDHFDTTDGGVIKVSTFGGLDIPTVTGYMGGFKSGIAYYKASNSASKVEWVNLGSTDEHFSNSFAVGDGKAVSQKLIDKGVDIILPVAGAQTEDALKAYESEGKKGLVIGVDTVQEDYYTTSHLMAFSILKDLKTPTINLLNQIVNKATVASFYKGLGQTTEGNLDDNLVGISESANSIFKLKNDFATAVANATIKAQAVATGTSFDIK